MNWENAESTPGHTEPLGHTCCHCRLSWVLVVAELSPCVCTVLFKLAKDRIKKILTSGGASGLSLASFWALPFWYTEYAKLFLLCCGPQISHLPRVLTSVISTCQLVGLDCFLINHGAAIAVQNAGVESLCFPCAGRQGKHARPSQFSIHIGNRGRQA